MTNDRPKRSTDEKEKSTFWQSFAHLMAEALRVLYPGIKFDIGPEIENGYYYDQKDWINQGYWSWKNLADQLPYDY